MAVVDGASQNAATAVNVGTEIDCTSCSAIAAYVVGTGVTSGGNYTIETSDTAGFTGTWAVVQASAAASAVSAGVKLRTTFTGPFHYVRVNITVAITGGGTLTARIIGI